MTKEQLKNEASALIEEAYQQGYDDCKQASETSKNVIPQTLTSVQSEGQTVKEKGALLYKVGMISDIHFDTQDSHNSEYIDDFINAINYFRNNDVNHIAHCGDMVNYKMADLDQFGEYYNVYAWAATGGKLRLFTAIGNHDCYLLQSKKFFENGDNEHTHIGHHKGAFANYNGEGVYKDLSFFEFDGKWNEQKVGDRTNKSKLSYYVTIGNDLWVVLSTDYGTDPEVSDSWGLMSQACNHLDYSDKYVKQLQEYVTDTQYKQSEDGAFDYQFYSANLLVWLKDIIENNTDKRIFIVTHHPFPQKAGNGTPWTADGNFYSKSRVYPYTDCATIRNSTTQANSNTLCGLEFYFLNKLCNTYKNTIWFSGHTHFAWNDEDPTMDVCKEDYPIYKPDGEEHFSSDNVDSITEWNPKMYARHQGEVVCKSATTVHIPSLSRPVDRKQGTALYGASEGALLEVYENAVIMKEIVFKREKETKYVNEIIKEIEL